jgi:phage terminase small subunit
MPATRAKKAAKAKGELLPLNPREEKFVAHYSVHFNGAAAARFAGFAPGGGERNYARELLIKPYIQKHISAKLAELGELHFRLADENTSLLRTMRDADRTAIFDDTGALKDPKDWPEECKALLAGIEVEERTVGEGENAQVIRVKKVRLEPPKGVIDSLAKISGQFIERSQLLDRHGRPVDPLSVRPVINLTLGQPKAK